MPSISKIRFTNVVYEDGNKRYNDETFIFDGHNGAILLENGGGKTVFIHTALQAILPHTDLAERKIKYTLKLEEAPAHVAIEWIIHERPRRYVVTAVTLFLTKDGLDSYRYVYEYGENDTHSIDKIPFVKEDIRRNNRSAERVEMQEYYSTMSQNYKTKAETFTTIKEFKAYIEEHYQIIPNEWESIVKINSSEGGVEKFFEECKTTSQLFDRLLIPTIEDSINGLKAEDFAETFEKHRSSFKEYKRLKEKIEENKQIKQELDRYVKVFEGLYHQEEQYQKIKQRSKAYAELNSQQLREIKVEKENLQLNQEEWGNKSKKYHIKKASYEIAVEQEKQAKTVTDHQILKSEYEEKLQQHEEKESYYSSLKLALAKKKQQDSEENKQIYLEKLEKIDQELDIDELKEQVDKNSRELKGFFIQQLEKYEKQQNELRFESISLLNQLAGQNTEQDQLITKKNELEKNHSNNQTLIHANETEMQRIAKAILSQPDQEKVEEQLKVWIEKRNELDEETAILIHQNKQLETEKHDRKNKIDIEQKQLQELIKVRSTLSTKIEQVETAHDQLKEKLAGLKYQWSNLDSVYLKQDSIKHQFSETINRIEREREELLYKERLSYRFVDDYGNQDIFYSDPFLAQQLENWQNQFSFLETGVRYVQNHGQGNQQDYQNNPLWPTTLITTEKEKDKLILKINQIVKQLQFPVYVLTTDEARQLFVANDQNETWISPLHWQQNMDQLSFERWKQTIQDQANESRKSRKGKEDEKKIWDDVYSQFQQFIEQFSYTDYQKLKEEKDQSEREIFQLNQLIKKIHEQIEETEHQIKINQEKIATNHNQMNGLAQRIEKGKDFLQLKKKNQEMHENNIFLKEEVRKLDQKINGIKRGINRLQERVKDLNQRIGDVDSDIKVLKNHSLYSPVIQMTNPIFTEKTLDNLSREHKELNDELNKVSKTRNEIETIISKEEENIKNFQQQIEIILKENEYLNENLIFPYNGQEIINQLLEQIKIQKKQLEELNLTRLSLKEKEDKQTERVATLTEQFSQKYPQQKVVSFNEPLELVEQQLNSESVGLQQQKEHLQKEEIRIQQQQEEIDHVREQFNRFDMKHQYMNPLIVKTNLSPEEITNFAYYRKKIADELFAELEEMFKQRDNELGNVNRAKIRFKDFCNHQITDVKMKERSIKGIENKNTYDEVIQFKHHMENRIQQVTNYAEQHIISHDEQLQQFITHLLSWIQKIADELKVIPKKTRIKIEEQWKDIYQFTIPEWNEDEGKSHMRNHIEWILSQLEKDNYKGVDGNEDTGKMRKDIETWLQSKQLLRVVMREKNMKVSLHKVGNNNQISTRLYTWEQSNNWSGGEKWSKNMTLFLGMLNYIAEKRQHIKPKMKCHRTVIVDNPFGKASSEHVLNPVFFIAEQLGFQIIALTALAEGKFLRDYFPIIYSCKLRQAVGSEKQIMTKEKILHHAYFQDHEPESMERLGETEQLHLF